MLVATGDEHDSNNYQNLVAAFEARDVRGSLYVVNYNRAPDADTLAQLQQAGHEFGLHPWVLGATPWGLSDLEAAYDLVLGWFTARSAVPSRTIRLHQVAWFGWVDAARVAADHNIGLDASFYNWGPAITYTDGRQAKGFINGSGLPMRFVDEGGSVLSVYQQVTSLVDEQLVVDSGGTCCSERLSAADAIAVSRQLIDASEAGGFSAITTQFHADYYNDRNAQCTNQRLWTDGTMDYALSLGIPIWTAERWLEFAESRAGTAVAGLAYQPGDEVVFTVTVPAGSEPLSLYMPSTSGTLPLRRVSIDGALAPISDAQVGGRSVGMFSVAPAPTGEARSVRVKYGDAPVPGNSLPVAIADQASTALGSPVTIPVLDNDTDPDGDELQVTGAGPAGVGSVTIAGGASITYTPDGGTCGSDSFTYTVSDGRGGFATATVSVTIGCANVITQTTVADFAGACTARTRTRVTGTGDGEVLLAGALGDDFDGATLGAEWAAGPDAPLLSGGVLTVSGPDWTWEWVRSASTHVVTTFEARVQFHPAQYQHVGWADEGINQYLIFSTHTGDGNLYARSSIGTPEQTTSLGPVPAGFHHYRIERTAQEGTDLVRYYFDGAMVAEHTVAPVPPLHAYVSRTAGGSIDVDFLWVYPPFVSGGAFDSCPLDGGATVSWTTATWTAQLSGGTLGVRTQTSTDGVSWSPWSEPLTTSGQPVTSPEGRYLRYQVALASATGDLSPVLESISFEYAATGNQAPVVTNPGDQTSAEGAVVTLSIAANDPDGDDLTFSATGLPLGLTIDAGTGVVSGTVAYRGGGDQQRRGDGE